MSSFVQLNAIDYSLNEFINDGLNEAGLENEESLEVEAGALDVEGVLFNHHESFESPVQKPGVVVNPLQSVRNVVRRRQVLAHSKLINRYF